MPGCPYEQNNYVRRPIWWLGMRGKILEARFCYLITSDLLERVCVGGAHSSAGIVTPLPLTRPKDTRSMKVTLTSWYKITNNTSVKSTVR